MIQRAGYYAVPECFQVFVQQKPVIQNAVALNDPVYQSLQVVLPDMLPVIKKWDRERAFRSRYFGMVWQSDLIQFAEIRCLGPYDGPAGPVNFFYIQQSALPQVALEFSAGLFALKIPKELGLFQRNLCEIKRIGQYLITNQLTCKRLNPRIRPGAFVGAVRCFSIV